MLQSKNVKVLVWRKNRVQLESELLQMLLLLLVFRPEISRSWPGNAKTLLAISIISVEGAWSTSGHLHPLLFLTTTNLSRRHTHPRIHIPFGSALVQSQIEQDDQKKCIRQW